MKWNEIKNLFMTNKSSILKHKNICIIQRSKKIKKLTRRIIPKGRRNISTRKWVPTICLVIIPYSFWKTSFYNCLIVWWEEEIERERERKKGKGKEEQKTWNWSTTGDNINLPPHVNCVSIVRQLQNSWVIFFFEIKMKEEK